MKGVYEIGGMPLHKKKQNKTEYSILHEPIQM